MSVGHGQLRQRASAAEVERWCRTETVEMKGGRGFGKVSSFPPSGVLGVRFPSSRAHLRPSFLPSSFASTHDSTLVPSLSRHHAFCSCQEAEAVCVLLVICACQEAEDDLELVQARRSSFGWFRLGLRRRR